jgi:hypothetical protein
MDWERAVSGRVARTVSVAVATAAIFIAGCTTAWAQHDDRSGKGNDRRPPSFNPHMVALAGAGGFAVNGCFPGPCADAVTRDGAGVARVNDCGGRALDNFGVSLMYVEHPPLTPEERRELDERDRRCRCQGPPTCGQDFEHRFRHAMLKGKLERFRHHRRELNLAAHVGTTHYVAETFDVVVDHAGPGERPHIVALSRGSVAASEFRPWKRGGCRLVSLRASLRQACVRPGVAPRTGSLELSVVPHQGAPCAFGMVRIEGSAPELVMSHVWWHHGRHPHPGWHRWCKPGREDEGDLEGSDDRGRDGGGRDGGDDRGKDNGKGKDKGKGKGKGNNGVGNGADPQPPGDPKINDGAGTGPGNPGNKGGSSAGPKKGNEGGKAKGGNGKSSGRRRGR